MTEAPSFFNETQEQFALDAMIAEIAEMPIVPAIISVGRSHVHFLAQFGSVEIRPGAGRIKAAATRELRANGFRGKRVWTKGCDMKSKNDARAFENAYRYVFRHREQHCLVYTWDIELWFDV